MNGSPDLMFSAAQSALVDAKINDAFRHERAGIREEFQYQRALVKYGLIAVGLIGSVVLAVGAFFYWDTRAAAVSEARAIAKRAVETPEMQEVMKTLIEEQVQEATRALDLKGTVNSIKDETLLAMAPVLAEEFSRKLDEEAQNILSRMNTDLEPRLRASIEAASLLVPIGTIVPFAGAVVNGKLEAQGGAVWLLCNGQEIDGEYPALFGVLSGGGLAWNQPGRATCVPDLTGRFLRGSDSRRPVGTREDWSTAMPRIPFQLGLAGEHVHSMVSFGGTDNHSFDGAGVQRSDVPNLPEKRTTDLEGRHSHAVVGGDEETRPDNVSISWLIRAK